MRTLAQAYWGLIRGAKRWVAATVGLFLLAAAAGAVVGMIKPSLIDELRQHGPEIHKTGFPAFAFILKQNLKVMLITWCGSFVLGIAPLFLTLATGAILAGLLADLSVTYGFLATFPHGIIELPAVLLSNALFLRLGLRWVFQKNAGDRKRTFLMDFQNSLKIAGLCGVLFFVAALIEAFVTSKMVAAYEKEHLAGIGVQVGIRDHQVTLTHVFPKGPAARAGLCSGVLLQKINGIETVGKDRSECRGMIHGRVGTKVKLEVVDPTHTKTNLVELVREIRP